MLKQDLKKMVNSRDLDITERTISKKKNHDSFPLEYSIMIILLIILKLSTTFVYLFPNY